MALPPTTDPLGRPRRRSGVGAASTDSQRRAHKRMTGSRMRAGGRARPRSVARHPCWRSDNSSRPPRAPPRSLLAARHLLPLPSATPCKDRAAAGPRAPRPQGRAAASASAGGTTPQPRRWARGSRLGRTTLGRLPTEHCLHRRGPRMDGPASQAPRRTLLGSTRRDTTAPPSPSVPTDG
eukprot:scaffold1588_cov408-Prasinococcus_capsulatus_cf.AAC.1